MPNPSDLIGKPAAGVWRPPTELHKGGVLCMAKWGSVYSATDYYRKCSLNSQGAWKLENGMFMNRYDCVAVAEINPPEEAPDAH